MARSIRRTLTMKNYLNLLIVALAATLAVACATNGGYSKIETEVSFVALDKKGEPIKDAAGDPVFNRTNTVAKVSMKQLAAASASAIKDFDYQRKDSVLGDVKTSLGSSEKDAKLDPEVLRGLVEGVVDALKPGP